MGKLRLKVRAISEEDHDELTADNFKSQVNSMEFADSPSNRASPLVTSAKSKRHSSPSIIPPQVTLPQITPDHGNPTTSKVGNIPAEYPSGYREFILQLIEDTMGELIVKQKRLIRDLAEYEADQKKYNADRENYNWRDTVERPDVSKIAHDVINGLRAARRELEEAEGIRRLAAVDAESVDLDYSAIERLETVDEESDEKEDRVLSETPIRFLAARAAEQERRLEYEREYDLEKAAGAGRHTASVEESSSVEELSRVEESSSVQDWTSSEESEVNTIEPAPKVAKKLKKETCLMVEKWQNDMYKPEGNAEEDKKQKKPLYKKLLGWLTGGRRTE